VHEMQNVPSFDMSTILKFNDWFEEAFYKGDYSAMASAYMEDAKLLAEDTAVIVGRNAIEIFWKQTCERGKAIQMKREIFPEEIASSGDLGYVRGTVKLEIPSGSKGPVVMKYVTVWKCANDGFWRIIVDISNRDAPTQ
jgi:ketosteroid isomerase-like protein